MAHSEFSQVLLLERCVKLLFIMRNHHGGRFELHRAIGALRLARSARHV